MVEVEVNIGLPENGRLSPAARRMALLMSAGRQIENNLFFGTATGGNLTIDGMAV